VRTPAILWEATSRRVLTMEWIDGVKLTDKAKMDAAGLGIIDFVNVRTPSLIAERLKHRRPVAFLLKQSFTGQSLPQLWIRWLRPPRHARSRLLQLMTIPSRQTLPLPPAESGAQNGR